VSDPLEPLSEAQLDALFTPGCDPYRAGAAALFSKDPEAVTQEERDALKRVFMRILIRRREWEAADRMACTGSLVHDEFTLCPVHDSSRPSRW
jgi:hypothetical protein